MSELFLRSAEATTGPFAEPAVRQRCARGELSLATLSWRPGEPRWTTLNRRWSNRFGMLGIAALGWSVTLGGIALAIWVPKRMTESVPVALQLPWFLMLATIAALAIMLLGTIFYWRRIVARNLGRPTLGAALCALMSMMGCIIAIATATLQDGVLDIRMHHPNARVAFDPASRQLRVEGPIGARLPADIDDALRMHPDVARMVIKSPGGLIYDATAVAENVRNRKLPVRVDTQCASACVLIWAASPAREMNLDSRLGLHQSRLDAAMPAAWIANVKQTMDSESTSLLKQAGFSDALLAKQTATSAQSMYWLNAVDAIDAGLVLQIVDGQGNAVGVDEARLRLALGSVGTSLPPQKFAEALFRKDRSLAEAKAPDLYRAWRANDVAATVSDFRELRTAARTDGLSRASDAAVVGWAEHRRALADDAFRRNDIESCSYLEGRKVARSPRTQKLGSDTIGEIANLLDAIPEHASLIEQPIPASYEAISRDASIKVYQHIVTQGFSRQSASWPSLQLCDYTREYLQLVERLPSHQAAQAIRLSEGVKTSRADGN